MSKHCMARRSAAACRALFAQVVLIALSLLPSGALAAPSTFGTIFGSAVLCFDDVDHAYFYDYLSASFGPAYKREGGAYWFKADARLWGMDISDVIVSDDSSAWVFVAAVSDATPDKLDEAIAAAAGVRHDKADQSAFPVRQARQGSKIVYFNTKSKIYCARYKPFPRG
jgi:hypothetical protein